MHDEHPHPLLAQVPLTVSPFLTLPTATPLPYTYKQLPSTLPPSMLSQPASSHPPSQPPLPPSANNNNTSSDPSSSQQQQPQQSHQPAYVISATGTTALHPDAILSSCHALQSHLHALESSARHALHAWDEQRRQADLAEKRRVAPGWLDGDVRILRPENVVAEQQGPAGQGQQDVAMSGGGGGGGGGGQSGDARPPLRQRHSVGIQGLMERRDGIPDSREGEELDRAFGGMGIR